LRPDPAKARKPRSSRRRPAPTKAQQDALLLKSASKAKGKKKSGVKTGAQGRRKPQEAQKAARVTH
jgi:hypothetical protein